MVMTCNRAEPRSIVWYSGQAAAAAAAAAALSQGCRLQHPLQMPPIMSWDQQHRPQAARRRGPALSGLLKAS